MEVDVWDLNFLQESIAASDAKRSLREWFFERWQAIFSPKSAKFWFGYFPLAWTVFFAISCFQDSLGTIGSLITNILFFDPNTADLSWQEPVISYYSSFLF